MAQAVWIWWALSASKHWVSFKFSVPSNPIINHPFSSSLIQDPDDSIDFKEFSLSWPNTTLLKPVCYVLKGTRNASWIRQVIPSCCCWSKTDAEMRSGAQICIYVGSWSGQMELRTAEGSRVTTKLRNINQNIAVNGEIERGKEDRQRCVNIGDRSRKWWQPTRLEGGLAVMHKAQSSDLLVKHILLPVW